MNKNIDFKLIQVIRKPNTGNQFLNGLINFFVLFLYPLIIILGLVFVLIIAIFSIFQNFIFSKSKNNSRIIAERKLEENNNLLFEEWSSFTSVREIKLFQKFCGEIRFGPMYLNLKSEPSIEKINGKIFGDWFYIYQNGIFLQQWNSTKNPDANLVFINSNSFEIEIIKENIPSVFWVMELDKNGDLELICDSGTKIFKYEINMHNYIV